MSYLTLLFAYISGRESINIDEGNYGHNTSEKEKIITINNYKMDACESYLGANTSCNQLHHSSQLIVILIMTKAVYVTTIL